MEKVLAGVLPFSEHELKVMNNEQKHLRSRWAGYATRAQMKTAFELYAKDGGVNHHILLAMERKLRKQARASQPLPAAKGVLLPCMLALARATLDRPVDDGAGADCAEQFVALV